MPINVTGYYYYSDDGHRIIKQYRAKDVPAIIIGMQVINYRDYEGDNAMLEQPHPRRSGQPDRQSLLLLSPCPAMRAQSRASARHANGQSLNLQEISLYTISAVLGAGLVAGFNPCLLGILVFLAASVLSTTGKRRELVMMVVFFSLGIFTMYFLFGLGMQQLLQTEAIASAFRYILTAFLLLAGLSQVWDALRLHAGKAISLPHGLGAQVLPGRG